VVDLRSDWLVGFEVVLQWVLVDVAQKRVGKAIMYVCG